MSTLDTCRFYPYIVLMATKGTKGGEKTGGRVKGTPNKLTAEIKKAMSESFEIVGKTDYFVKLANDHPKVYGALIAKYIPSKIEAEIEIKDGLTEKLAERRKKASDR